MPALAELGPQRLITRRAVIEGAAVTLTSLFATACSSTSENSPQPQTAPEPTLAPTSQPTKAETAKQPQQPEKPAAATATVPVLKTETKAFTQESAVDPETPTQAERQAGLLWRRAFLAHNLPINTHARLESPPPYFKFDSSKTILMTDKSGLNILINQETGRTEKVLPSRGVILGANEQTVVVALNKDIPIIEIVDLALNKVTGRIEGNPNIPKKLLWPAFIHEDVVLIPEEKTVLGTYDKVTAYDFAGKKLWETESGENHHLMAATHGFAVTVTNEELLTRNIQTGETELLEVPRIKSDSPWTFTIKDNFLFVAAMVDLLYAEGGYTIKQDILRVKNEPARIINVKLVDLTTKDVFREQLVSGVIVNDPITKKPFCAQHCSVNLDRIMLSIYDFPHFREVRRQNERTLELLVSEKTLDLKLQTQISRNVFVEASLVFSLDQKEFVLVQDVSETNIPTIEQGSGITPTGEYFHWHSLQDGRLTLAIPVKYVINDKNEKIVTSENLGYYFLKTPPHFLGRIGENHIFTSWDTKKDSNSTARKFIHAVNPQQDNKNPIWSKDLETSQKLQAVIINNQIYIAGESLLEIDTKTGAPKLLNILPSSLNISQIWPSGENILAQVGNSFVAVSTKPAL